MTNTTTATATATATKDKGKGQVLDTALLHDEHRSALQSRKWQLIDMS